MSGAIEKELSDRYGAPSIVPSEPFVEHRWNDENEANQCVLYKGLVWSEPLVARWGALMPLYGDIVGGFLIGIPSSIKLAMLRGPEVFGLYSIDELEAHSEVQRAHRLDPNVCFFMDSANVWFYGVKDGQLFVYDSENEELDCLGPFASGFGEVLDEWEQAQVGR